MFPSILLSLHPYRTSVLIVSVITAALACMPANAADGLESKGREFLLTFLPNYHTNEDFRGDSLYVFIAADSATSGLIEYYDRNGNYTSRAFTIREPAEVHTERFWYRDLELHGYAGLDGNEVTLDSPQAQDERIALQHFRISAEKKIAVYGLNYAKYSSDAFLAFPVEALGREYMIMSYNSNELADWRFRQSTPSQFAVLAAENNTTVQISPATATARNGTAPQTIQLDAGQVYLVQARLFGGAYNRDLTGSRITADKPVAVFAGHQRATLPLNGSGHNRDHLVEQLIPLEAWGRSAFVIPYPRLEGGSDFNEDLVRVIAANDNTVIRVNGTPLFTLDAGRVYETRLENPAYLEADGPISVAQFKHSSGGTNGDWDVGDPFMMLIPPREQYLGAYRIINAQVLEGGRSDNTMITRQFVTVIIPTENRSALRIDGQAVNTTRFAPIPASEWSYGHVEVEDGVHTLEADVPFGVYAHGYGPANSYGYIGGVGLRAISVQLSGEGSYEICEGEQIELAMQVANATEDTRYRWTPATGLSNPDILNPVAAPAQTTRYTLTVSGKNIQTASTSVTVSVLPQFRGELTIADPNREYYPGDKVGVYLRVSALEQQNVFDRNIEAFRITLQHDSLAFLYSPGSLRDSSGLDGWTITAHTNRAQNRLTISGYGPRLVSASFLLRFDLNTYLTTHGETTKAVEILAMEFEPAQTCTPQYTHSPISFADFCLRNLRGIRLGSNGFALAQNTPNPTDGSTGIGYSIAFATHTMLTIYDALGREVLRPVDTFLEPGSYVQELPAGILPSGTYFYRLQAGPFSAVRWLHVGR